MRSARPSSSHPDAGAASGALHALDAQLTACADLHDNAFIFTMDKTGFLPPCGSVLRAGATSTG